MSDTAAIQSASLGGSAAHDMSMLGLFLESDIVIKLVMLLLAFLSVWCWAIILQKNGRMKSLSRRADKFEEAFWSGDPLDKLYERVVKQAKGDPMLKVFTTGMEEWRTESKGAKMPDGAMDRVETMMRVSIKREVRELQKGFGVLASTASMAAFIGLFGTVWGIVRSFTNIAAMQNTSLAVVAPGIAEALYATGVGLFAALTGMWGINILRSKVTHYNARLGDFVSEFATILSRHSGR